MSMPKPVIAVEGLAKTYDRQLAVRGVTLRLLPGEILGLVGANGGGKTTTLRMLAGLLRPDAGQGTVLGDDVRHPRPDRRRRLGYMSQKLALYPDLSVAENLRFHGVLHGLDDPLRRIADLAALYGLENVLEKRFGQLSGGWARRVQFVATILHDPKLLLLDEPAAGLDLPTRQAIWAWLKDLSRKGCGIVISTHDPAEAMQCGRIVYYRDGVAHAAMTPQEMLARTGAASLEAAILAMEGPRAA